MVGVDDLSALFQPQQFYDLNTRVAVMLGGFLLVFFMSTKICVDVFLFCFYDTLKQSSELNYGVERNCNPKLLGFPLGGRLGSWSLHTVTQGSQITCVQG